MTMEEPFSDNIISRKNILSMLVDIISSTPQESNFMELSKEKELSYTIGAADRWHEILSITASVTSLKRDLSILDIGTSPFTFLLKEYFTSVSTLDLTEHFSQRCLSSKINLYSGGLSYSLNQLPANNYDIIFCLEILEHVHINPIDILKELRMKLKEGGVLILSTPNLATLSNRINLIFNRKLKWFSYPPFDESGFSFEIHGYGHDRIYLSSELVDYALAAGFKSVKLRYQLYERMQRIKKHRYNVIQWLLLGINLIMPSTRGVTVLIAGK